MSGNKENNELDKEEINGEFVESFHDRYLFDTVQKNWNNSRSPELDLIHAVMGLAEESGEVAGLVKKHFFYGKDFEENPRNIKVKDYINELGDVTYYLMKTLDCLGISLEHVMQENAKKLAKRHKEGFKGGYSE